MSVRKKYDQRCLSCFMKDNLCLCEQIPNITLLTKVIVIVGKRESTTPTNTGRLATQALTNSVMLVRGDLEQSYDLAEHLPPGHSHLLLYPSDDAEILSPQYMSKVTQPCTLVVPDGNWRQANKMRHRDAMMRALPLVKIAPGMPTQYKVRKESQPEGLATIEAIARALGVMEGPEVQEKLEQLLHVMVSRTLASRGVKDC